MIAGGFRALERMGQVFFEKRVATEYFKPSECEEFARCDVCRRVCLPNGILAKPKRTDQDTSVKDCFGEQRSEEGEERERRQEKRKGKKRKKEKGKRKKREEEKKRRREEEKKRRREEEKRR